MKKLFKLTFNIVEQLQNFKNVNFMLIRYLELKKNYSKCHSRSQINDKNDETFQDRLYFYF